MKKEVRFLYQKKLNACFVVFCFLISLNVLANSGAWSPTAVDLFWDNNANWTDVSFPNAQGVVAAFINYPGTVVVDSTTDITIASLHLDLPNHSLTIGFTNKTLTFDKEDGQANIFVANQQTHFIDTPVVLDANVAIFAGDSASLDFSQEISGTGSFTVTADGGTHIQLSAANTYSGGTIVESGFLHLNGPGSTKNVPGDIIVKGSGLIDHDPTASDNYASGAQMNLLGGTVFLNGTTQRLNKLFMTKQASVQSSDPSTLRLSSGDLPTLIIGGDSLITVDTLVMENGGAIVNDSSQPGLGFFRGDFSASGVMTIDLNGNMPVRINADNNPFQGQTGFELDFYNVQIINGTLEKTGAGTVLFEGNQSSIPDLNVLNGAVQIGRADGTPSVIDGPTMVTLTLGSLLNGFGALGIGGNASVINNAGSVVPGDKFALGTLTISGNYEQHAQGALYVQGFNPSAINTLIIQEGTVLLDGAFYFIAFPGALFNPGDQFVVIDNTGGAGISGTFSQFSAELPPCLSASLTYTTDQVIMSISACDESSGCLLPPNNLQVHHVIISCRDQNDFINRLTWSPSISAGVVKYNIYVNCDLIGSVDAMSALVFDHHYNPSIAGTFEYSVTSVTATGQESASVFVAISA